MDRIRQALDKNKSRGQQHYWRRKAILSQDFGKLPSHEGIEYAQTKAIRVPPSKLAENRLIAANRTDPRATPFSVLRTQVLHAMRENDWSSIAITGPLAGVGKSLVAANLAISISLEVNQTVLLVDADLRRPSLHMKFNFNPEYGLADYLAGDVELSKLMVNPEFKRLVMIPGKGSTPESSELLSSPKMQALTQELKSRYRSRIVIYDLPPLLSTDDSMVMLPYIDSSILVVENGKNTETDIVSSLRLLEGSNLIGTVLNKAEEETEMYY